MAHFLQGDIPNYGISNATGNYSDYGHPTDDDTWLDPTHVLDLYNQGAPTPPQETQDIQDI